MIYAHSDIGCTKIKQACIEMGLRIFALVHLLFLLISRKLKSLPYVFDNKNKILVSLPYESWEGRSQFLNCFSCWLIDSSLTDFKRNLSSAQKS